MQMAKTAQAFAELDEAGMLTISLITDPTYGGVAASFATLADVIFAEPGARMGFAGPRVIEQTTGETPAGGLPDRRVPAAPRAGRRRHARAPALRPALGRLLSFADRTGAGPPPACPALAALSIPLAALPLRPGRTVVRAAEELTELAPWETVRLARHPGARPRPTTSGTSSTDFQELHGDRARPRTARPSSAAPAWLDGLPVMLIGHQKGGRDLPSWRRRRFGMAIAGRVPQGGAADADGRQARPAGRHPHRHAGSQPGP